MAITLTPEQLNQNRITSQMAGSKYDPNTGLWSAPTSTGTGNSTGTSGEPTAGKVYGNFNAPTPVNNNPGRTYVGMDGNTYDETTGALVAHGDIGAVNEDKIRADVLKRFQSEIDASNQIYAEKLNEAKTQGLGRLGTGRATQARSGLLGSDFGNAQTDKINTENTSIENSIQAEKQAKIAEIMGKAYGLSTAEIASKRQAQQAGLEEYLKYLGKRSEDKKTNLQKLAGSLLDQKLSPNDISPEQLQELAKTYEVSTGDILTAFNAEKKVRDDAQKKLDTENAKTKAEQDLKERQLALDTAYKNGSLSIDRYNAETSRINAESAKFKAGLDANGNPIAGGASQIKADALKSATDLLDKFDKGKGTSAVGSSRIAYPFGTIPGTDAKDFEVQFNNLKSLLSLDNVKLLKGQGAVSDAERALLAQASSKLDLAQSEQEFRSALADIKSALSGTAQGGTNQTIRVKINATGQTGTVNASEFDPSTMTKI